MVMRRPGYLGNLNEFWGVRRTRQSRLGQTQAQILSRSGLGYYFGKGHDDDDDDNGFHKAQEHRQKEIEKQRKDAEKRAKELRKAQERMMKAAAERGEAQREAAAERGEAQREAAEEAREYAREYAPASMPAAPMPMQSMPASSEAPLPPLEPLPADSLPPLPDAALPPLPGMLPPVMLVPGISRALPTQRAHALPGRARPGPAPVITSQMARLGKIAAAIGAGLFLL